MTCLSPILIVQILISVFMAILFLQSGLDKFIDWSGNYNWLKGHFSQSPLKGLVPFMLGTISVFEVAAGALCGIGVFELIFTDGFVFAYYGLLVSAITILCLFLGQRMAKDYPGAAVLAGYFLLVVIGLYTYA